ncbi:hypothetical protein ASG47_18930 [Devosia sp. Leaf420]|uniref:5-oxoprolinase subunit B family protein n=1 Tax=Devosia sp. Leaf420 TaxID=1736374 RepID=UPI00071293AC|nr:carboxyltransferase domain-containing protein [Devosia sp. Leaf420]KQT51247.1 hypothetical protein ASG47_18930 [Devosia sp. Leaf420]
MLQPLGDSALLVRFGSHLDEAANSRAIAFAQAAQAQPIDGVVEIVPSLVSVLIRYNPIISRYQDIAGTVRLLLGRTQFSADGREWRLPIRFGGEHGADLDEVAGLLKMSAEAFIAYHNANPLRVLATGFAPGFVYCGFHPDTLILPRRNSVRPLVKAGSVLFAAGQTAIAATDVPTGWHVIGHTAFSNFDPKAVPPTQLKAGDRLIFEAV